MDTKRIETFTLNKRTFIHFDLSGMKTNDDFLEFVNSAKEFIKDFKPESVYTIANVDGVMFDSTTKEIVADWLEYNDKYVIYSSIFNVDGVKKIMLNSVMKSSKRKNIRCFNTRQQAVEWLSEI